MTVNNLIESVRHLPLSLANAKLEEICGVKSFFDRCGDAWEKTPTCRSSHKAKEEYGKSVDEIFREVYRCSEKA